MFNIYVGNLSFEATEDEVRGLFEELGLDEVLASIRTDDIEPPAELALVPHEQPTRDSHRLLLQAHDSPR